MRTLRLPPLGTACGKGCLCEFLFSQTFWLLVIPEDQCRGNKVEDMFSAPGKVESNSIESNNTISIYLPLVSLYLKQQHSMSKALDIIHCK